MSRPSIREETLPSRWYHDPALLQREIESIFHESWQWVARSEQLKAPGDTVTCDLSGEPLVLARDLDGELRAFYNVCRHRAGPVALGNGPRKNFQCSYHGWTYELDGTLMRAPEMEGTPGFEPSEICLPQVRVETWNGFVFVNLDDDAVPVAETFRGIDAGLGDGMRPVERREYEVDANWKVYVDNYLEGYHIPLVHPGLYELVDYERYRVETHSHHSQQVAPLRRGDDDALYYWLFPNMMLNFYPGSLQVNLVVPLTATTTLTVFEWYNTSGHMTAELADAIAFSDQVQREDMDIVAAVQKGLGSRSYDTGPLSAKRENGVAHFHALLRQKLLPDG